MEILTQFQTWAGCDACIFLLYLDTGTGARDEVYLQATQKGKHQQRHGMVGDKVRIYQQER